MIELSNNSRVYIIDLINKTSFIRVIIQKEFYDKNEKKFNRKYRKFITIGFIETSYSEAKNYYL